MRTLRRAWATAMDRRLVRFTPPAMPSLKTLPDDSRPKRRLKESELASLIQASREHPIRDHRDLGVPTLFAFLGWSGWRPGAAYDLRMSDVQRLLDPSVPRAEQLIYCRRDKGGVGRGWRPISEAARLAVLARVDEIRGLPHAYRMSLKVASPTNMRDQAMAQGRLERAMAMQGPEQQLWTRVRGGELNGSTVSRWMAVYAERAGLQDVQTYDLRRHACMQILKARSWDCEEAMQFTGHASAQTLLRYVYAPQRAAEDGAHEITWTLRVLGELQAEEG